MWDVFSIALSSMFLHVMLQQNWDEYDAKIALRSLKETWGLVVYKY